MTPEQTGEQERQTEMVVWRCPECGWYHTENGDRITGVTCDGVMPKHPLREYEPIPVIEASAVEGLVDSVEYLLDVLEPTWCAHDQQAVKDALAAYKGSS